MRRIPRAAGTSRRGEHPAPPVSARRGSAILYLLAAGERSHWHRLDAAEVWQWSAGEAARAPDLAHGDPTVVRPPARPGGRRWRRGPGRRPGRRLAGGPTARRMDAGRLHRRAGLRVRRLGARARRLGAADLISRPRASPTATRRRSAGRGTARRRTPPARARPLPDQTPEASSSSATTGLIAVCQTTACDPYSRIVTIVVDDVVQVDLPRLAVLARPGDPRAGAGLAAHPVAERRPGSGRRRPPRPAATPRPRRPGALSVRSRPSLWSDLEHVDELVAEAVLEGHPLRLDPARDEEDLLVLDVDALDRPDPLREVEDLGLAERRRRVPAPVRAPR